MFFFVGGYSKLRAPHAEVRHYTLLAPGPLAIGVPLGPGGPLPMSELSNPIHHGRVNLKSFQLSVGKPVPGPLDIAQVAMLCPVFVIHWAHERKTHDGPMLQHRDCIFPTTMCFEIPGPLTQRLASMTHHTTTALISHDNTWRAAVVRGSEQERLPHKVGFTPRPRRGGNLWYPVAIAEQILIRVHRAIFFRDRALDWAGIVRRDFVNIRTRRLV